MRIFITGANGQLGHELRRSLETGIAEIGPIDPAYENAEAICTDADELDITNEQEVQSAIADAKPDIVINCAALTNVDGCEAAPERAFEINALGPKYIAAASASAGATLVHVSTDYVFAGDQAGERRESDVAHPISAYGRTKFAGEEFVRELCPHHMIVRTAWLYGYVGKNFVKTMLRLAAGDKPWTVVDDQIGNPTSANDLAYEILALAHTDNWGTYHATNKGICSWFEFAQEILRTAGYDPSLVRPCTSAEYKAAHPDAAPRPAYSALKNEHLEQTIGDAMRPWKEALHTYLKNLPQHEG